MKRNIIYILFLVLMVGTTAFVAIRYEKKKTGQYKDFYELKNRSGALAEYPEWKQIKNTWEDLVKKTRINPDDTKGAISLATLYLQEGRNTGDHLYYDAAAMKYILDVLEKEPGNFTALSLKAMVQLSQHHFSEGLETAIAAKEINKENAFIYGLLTDANVELGNYQDAVKYADKMVSIRPDLRSYSRISYLREIYGDLDGAIAAMKMAVDAGLPGDESTAWCRTQLANLYEQKGDLRSAEMHYLLALETRPGYAHALNGLGKIASERKEWEKAGSLFKQANAVCEDYSFSQHLADVYRQMGKTSKASELETIMLNKMIRLNEEASRDETLGHYSDLELAHAYIQANQVSRALKHALLEYNRRPENIDVNTMMAWVLLKKGEINKAISHINKALKTGSKNPELLSKASLIYFAAGQKDKAKELAKSALQNNPILERSLKSDTYIIINS